MIPHNPKPFPTVYTNGIGEGGRDQWGTLITALSVPKHDPRDGRLAKIRTAFYMRTREIIEGKNMGDTVGSITFAPGSPRLNNRSFSLFSPLYSNLLGSLTVPIPEVTVEGIAPGAMFRGTSQYIDNHVFDNGDYFPGTSPPPGSLIAARNDTEANPGEWLLQDADDVDWDLPDPFAAFSVKMPFQTVRTVQQPIVVGDLRFRITTDWQCTVNFLYLPFQPA